MGKKMTWTALKFSLTVVAGLFLGTNIYAAPPPNVVLIYADDLGYGDLGCYGNERIPTPNCDRLAKEGLRFAQAYTAASVCTPARYSLLTGRYPWRTWLKSSVVGNTPALIDPDTFTMADLFKEAGYATAVIGKWHIGFGNRGQRDLDDWNVELPKGPRELGFDYFFGMPVSHFYPPYVYIENRRVYNLDPADPLTLIWPDQPGMPTQKGGVAALYKQEEAGRELADRACRYIKEKKDEPFFLYYAAIEPHTPLTPHPDYKGKSKVGDYGDFVFQFDDGVGRILQTLEKNGLAENTIVILTSDNGGVGVGDGFLQKTAPGYNPNVPLRGDKGDFFEGGLRIPFIIRWPGVVEPNSLSQEVVCQTDLLAAFAELLDVTIPEGAAEDSYNVLPVLKGGSIPDRPIVLQSRAGFHALSYGDWIYLDGATLGDFNTKTPLVQTPGQLYNLADDLHQDTNLYEAYPERVARMKKMLNEIRNKRAIPLPKGDGSTVFINPKTPEQTHLGWNAELWGDPALPPVEGNHYILDRPVWLHGLGGTFGSFQGESLTVRKHGALFISGSGSLGGMLVLDGGQLQNRSGQDAVIHGEIRVDADSTILNISGNLKLNTAFSGKGDLLIRAHQAPGTKMVFVGTDAGYKRSFVLGNSGADQTHLLVEFQTSYPNAELLFQGGVPSRASVYLLKNNITFRAVGMPSAADPSVLIPLSPGTYNAAALMAKGIHPAYYSDQGGSLCVKPK